MSEALDQQQLEFARRGDRDALAALLQRHEGRLYNVCLRMVQNADDAAELTQDTLVQVIKHLNQFDGRSQVGTWMVRIAMNASLSHLRKRKHRKTMSLDADATGNADALPLRLTLTDMTEPDPVSSVQNREMLDRLIQTLDTLEEQHRAVLVLRDLQQMDYAQISEALDLPVGTVKSRLFRAREALRAAMLKSTGETKQASA